MNRQIRNLIINIPPRHMKSGLVCVFFPAWVWGPMARPQDSWLFGSYSPKLSTRDSVACRRLLDSDIYRSLWAHNFIQNEETRDMYKHNGSLLRHDQNEKMRYQNIHSGTRISTSVGGTGTGDGGDFLVVDDPHKVKGVESQVQRASAIDWWDNEMSTRGNDPKTVCKLVIQQRVHAGDVCGNLLEKAAENWEHLCIPFEYERNRKVFISRTSLNFKDPRKKEGELLWADRYNEKAVSDLKSSLTIYQQSGQLQQRPTPKQGKIFKRQYFKYRWKELPQDMDKVFDTWDLSFGEEEEHAMNVGYKVGKKGSRYYVMDEIRDHMGLLEQIKFIMQLRKSDARTRASVIENKANAHAVISVIKKKVTGLIRYNPKGDKETRAEAQEPLFHAGNVIFPADSAMPWAEEAVEEFISFGKTAVWKDRVDALCQGLDWSESKSASIGDAVPESMEKLQGWAIS